jgi:hypothetical protein
LLEWEGLNMYVFASGKRDRERHRMISFFSQERNRVEEKEEERKEKGGELHDSFMTRARFWSSVSQSCERCFESRVC